MSTTPKYVILAATILLGGLTALTPRASAQGGVPLWTNLFRGSDTPARMAVDRSGNVVVAGWLFPYDYAIVSYSNDGMPLWTNHYKGPGNSYGYPTAIVVDRWANVFVTGVLEGSGGLNDWATLKYSNTGVPIWTNRYGSVNNDDQARAIAVDSEGSLFVTGFSRTNNDFSSADYITIKYSDAGVPLWTNRYNGPANDSDGASAIAVDGSGNLFVTGSSSAASGYSDYATIKYASTGMPLWTNRYKSSANQEDYATAIAVDSSGNVFVTGWSAAANGSQDYLTIKYSNAGVPLWTNRYNGPAQLDDYVVALATDSITGMYSSRDLP